ncbi:MAG: bifunctional nicotinamidase/pyrazinamidase [Rouxiella badensis]|uniref:bifunctional nicotinamidase/pyrazinamidase n=1 Tax=Rouxiella badensis TaxID=1646377 RepID=UPI003C6716F5
MKSALLLIDLQNDFCHGGALAVAEGDETVNIANLAIAACRHANIKVVASQDWHPADHRSFALNSSAEPWTIGELEGLPQVWWPVHCVQNTPGADFHPELNTAGLDYIVHKGQDAAIDSYSAFFDNGKRAATALHPWLQREQVEQLIVMGLATDYCVKFSVLDALALGYQVTLLSDGCRGVNLQPDDSKRAIEEMQQAGAKVQNLSQLVSNLHFTL